MTGFSKYVSIRSIFGDDFFKNHPQYDKHFSSWVIIFTAWTKTKGSNVFCFKKSLNDMYTTASLPLNCIDMILYVKKTGANNHKVIIFGKMGQFQVSIFI